MHFPPALLLDSFFWNSFYFLQARLGEAENAYDACTNKEKMILGEYYNLSVKRIHLCDIHFQ